MPEYDEILRFTRALIDDYELDPAVRLGVDIFYIGRGGHGTRGYARNHHGLEIAWWIHTDRYVKEMDFLLKGLKLKGKERILSLGCGPGFHELVLAKFFPDLSILAIDLDTKEIATAKLIAKTMGVTNVVFKALDAEHLDELKDEPPFDRVISLAALHDVPDLKRVFQKLVPLLRDSAIIALTHNPHRRRIESADEPPLESLLDKYFVIEEKLRLITPKDAENYYGEIARKSREIRGYDLAWDAIVAKLKSK